jgi:glutamine---fructose-6-phosphate transaminase (isomerizing)
MVYLADEIREQPETLAGFLDGQLPNVADIAEEIRRRDIAHIIIAARGTSDNAGVYGRYALESLAGIVVSLAAPSLYTLYKSPPKLDRALVMGISQSGEGTDIVEVARQAARQGAMTLALTNNPESPLAKASECVIPLEAGDERSVAATKTYTAELMALAALTAALSGDKALWDALKLAPEAVQEALELEGGIREAVERYCYAEDLVVLGRGYNYATAFEVSLKLKETCYLSTQPYSTADFRHGPIAIIDEAFPALLIGPSGATYPDVLAAAQELAEKRAELIAISDQEELLGLARTQLRMPGGLPEWLTPIPYVVPGQLFALHLALTRGYNPDQPRGLSKVTKTT